MLRDCIRPGVRILFVGINPGMRSDALGHHFAGYSNAFWKLLHASGLVTEPIGYADDRRLPEWGLGITNLIARATPGIDTLRREEYGPGIARLRRKVRRFRPPVVALVGVSLCRAIFRRTGVVHLGWQPELFAGGRVYVVPNPSGRNAHYSFDAMLASFRGLAEEMDLRRR
jgi:TDG/mug DNA glycosylase family protein